MKVHEDNIKGPCLTLRDSQATENIHVDGDPHLAPLRVSDLTESEQKVWQAAATGKLVRLPTDDSELSSPERGTEWGPERTVRAEVIAALLVGDGEAASLTVRGVRLQGARIVGELNLEATTLRCPLALLDCFFASPINLEEAIVLSVRLSGSHVPAIHARQLRTRGDFRLDGHFRVSNGVDLAGAHIGGQLLCTDGHFSNPDGPALSADGLAVDQNMSCNEEFSASGEVRLAGAHIGGVFGCRGGQFSNADGPALSANGLTVDQNMYCDEGFLACGEVRLAGAHIGGVLVCTRGHFLNPEGRALNADRLAVDQYMFCREGFVAEGEVRLLGAHIGGQLNCTGGRFSNPDGYALSAYGLTVEADMYCMKGFLACGEVCLAGAHIGGQLNCTGGQFFNPDGDALSADGIVVDGGMYCTEGFVAEGEVRLLGAHISGQLNCVKGHFSNPKGSALNLGRTTVSGLLHINSAVLEGILDLTAAKTSSYLDNRESWPEKLRLDGFVYDAIEGASVKERLGWLRRNESGYSPQIYEQLAAVYHRAGNDGDAKRVLIEKQRQRTAKSKLGGKVWGFLLHWTVGYGYRTWLALLWWAGLLFLGTYLFGYVYASDLAPASKTTTLPPSQPFLYFLHYFLYTLDLLPISMCVTAG